jgi:signal transduction histidine kinase
LLDEVAEQVAPLAAARQIRLEVAHEGPIPVRADPDRLKQVLLNLVDNALRYTPADGTVRLIAALDPAGATARLQVRDTGPGIAPAHLPHIFDRFYRGDPSRARASGNTGLGLAIARGIVEAHGGTIAAQPGPTGGTAFTIVLPAARPGDPPSRR